MIQNALFAEEQPITRDMHVMLQLFINWRGFDISQDFEGLSHVYHSVHIHRRKMDHHRARH